MNCPNCNQEVFRTDNFCSKCGQKLPNQQVPVSGTKFAVFREIGSAWRISGEIHGTMDLALQQQNSPARLSLVSSGTELFLAEVQELPRNPFDRMRRISHKLKVIQWWKLKYQYGRWALNAQLNTHPEVIEVSSLER